MAQKEVLVYVNSIKYDLNDGLTWLKKDDLGYGSIQEKYNAKDQQINLIRKHPALKDLETTVTVFVVIDDSKDSHSDQVITQMNNEIKVDKKQTIDAIAPAQNSNVDDMAAFANL